MNLSTLAALAQTPHLRSTLALMRDFKTLARLYFLHAATSAGVLRRLREPLSAEALAARMEAKRAGLLEPLLQLGVALGELSCNKDRYALRGRRARALAEESGEPLAALVQEHIAYHGSVYCTLAERLAGAPLGEYLEATATLVARSSRSLEPLLKGFVQEVMRERNPTRLLEIGCGSGIYMCYAAEVCPGLRGLGIDMQESVVRDARSNLVRWNIEDRFEVAQADIRTAPAALDGPFDCITLYNNLYYFTPEERVPLFQRIRYRLAPGGTLALASLMRGNSVTSRNFDIVLRSTVGCAALPDSVETIRQLEASGFSSVERRDIMPSEHFVGITAR